MLGFQPLTSAGTATTSVPPAEGCSNGSSGSVAGAAGSVPGSGNAMVSCWDSVPLQPARPAAVSRTVVVTAAMRREVPPGRSFNINHPCAVGMNTPL